MGTSKSEKATSRCIFCRSQYTWWNSMSDVRSAAALAATRLQRLLSFRARAEFDQLSERVRRVRSQALSDAQLESGELTELFAEMQSVARKYDDLAAQSGLPASGLPDSADSFRYHAEAAEIHFSYLAGTKDDNFRARLLREYRRSKKPAEVAKRIGLDIATSASAGIAAAKIHLRRAAISLEASEDRRRALLEIAGAAIVESLTGAAWQQSGHSPALTEAQAEQLLAFRATVAQRRTR
jgi:hypothetical protein